MKVYIRYDKHDTWREVRRSNFGHERTEDKLEAISTLLKMIDIKYLEVRIEEDLK